MVHIFSPQKGRGNKTVTDQTLCTFPNSYFTAEYWQRHDTVCHDTWHDSAHIRIEEAHLLCWDSPRNRIQRPRGDSIRETDIK